MENKLKISDLNKRYKKISNEILNYLKKNGFERKGSKCIKISGDLLFIFSSSVSSSWLNNEEKYRFEINFALQTTNSNYLQVYMNIENEKKLTKAMILWAMITPKNSNGIAPYLTKQDSIEQDDIFISGVIEVINEKFIPIIKSLNSIDDVIDLVEKEYALERENCLFFRHRNIYIALQLLYGSKNWKEKTLKMCDEEIENINLQLSRLAAIRKEKYIKYFKQIAG